MNIIDLNIAFVLSCFDQYDTVAPTFYGHPYIQMRLDVELV